MKKQIFGQIGRLKPEKVEEYKELHAHAWPGVLKTIEDCNLRNYSIFIRFQPADMTKNLLFHFLPPTQAMLNCIVALRPLYLCILYRIILLFSDFTVNKITFCLLHLN